MNKLPHRLIAVIAMTGFSTICKAQAVPSQTRGELLYSTHCVACHTTQVHWRSDKRAFDWESLKSQVRRWEGNGGLAWSEADITEVSRYLNETIYQYPKLDNRVGLGSPYKPSSTSTTHAK